MTNLGGKKKIQPDAFSLANFPKGALGRHILAEFWECNPERLDDCTHIEQTMLDAARRAEATIITHSFHQFAPQGVSGAVIIAESHLSIHTWPELGYAAVDLFTCGKELAGEAALTTLRDGLEAGTVSVLRIPRGIPEAIHAEGSRRVRLAWQKS
jgi:S-adenosylmethionine decarboxylase proenzyme